MIILSVNFFLQSHSVTLSWCDIADTWKLAYNAKVELADLDALLSIFVECLVYAKHQHIHQEDSSKEYTV